MGGLAATCEQDQSASDSGRPGEFDGLQSATCHHDGLGRGFRCNREGLSQRMRCDCEDCSLPYHRPNVPIATPVCVVIAATGEVPATRAPVVRSLREVRGEPIALVMHTATIGDRPQMMQSPEISSEIVRWEKHSDLSRPGRLCHERQYSGVGDFSSHTSVGNLQMFFESLFEIGSVRGVHHVLNEVNDTVVASTGTQRG